MKILLIDPPELFTKKTGTTRQVLPLGLASVAACVPPPHQVRLLLPDTRSYQEDDPWGELKLTIAKEAPDVVGISALTPTLQQALRLVILTKTISPHIVTVLGGIHISFDPAGTMRACPEIDFVIFGEGEETFVELLSALETPEGVCHGSIPGLGSKKNNQIMLGPPRPPISDLDALPFPQRENLVWSEEILPGFYQSLITQRGCPYSCIFCATPKNNIRKSRTRSPKNVLKEIEKLYSRHKIEYLFFNDPVFTLNKDRTLELCDLLADRDPVIPFSCQTRTDRLDFELLSHLKNAGCNHILFGIESGCDESLKKINKGTTTRAIKEIVKQVKSFGIGVSGFFIIGFPWETRKQMQRTADFACELKLNSINLFSATPLPGTPLWELTGRPTLPDQLDFRTPEANFTQLDNQEYSNIFNQIKNQIEAANFDRINQHFRGCSDV